MNMDELVSVIIPTHNRPNLLRRAVQSVVDQTYRRLEIIVVDDASQPPVPTAWEDERIAVIRRDEAGGGAVARNHGLSLAKGRYLCLLDDDDYYFPEKINKQVAFLQDHPAIDLVFSKVAVMDSTGQRHYYLTTPFIYYPLKNFRFFNIIHTNATLFRREVLNLARFDERLSKYQDMQFHLAVCERTTTAYLPTTVAVWNRPGTPSKSKREQRLEKFRNFALICALFETTIGAYQALKWRYYGRLAFQAMRCLDLLTVIRCLIGICKPPRIGWRIPDMTGSTAPVEKLVAHR